MVGREPLLFGHKVALLYEGRTRAGEGLKERTSRIGYLQSTWSTGPKSSAPIGMLPLPSRDATPSNFESCIFRILCGDGELEQADSRRMGEEVKFGQIIRLVHVNQGKPLCCHKKRAGQVDKNGKRVTLEPIEADGGKRDWTSRFRIIPRYQVRGEGEKVCDLDQIMLQPVLSCPPHYLSVSDVHLRGTPFLEASAAPKDARDSNGFGREHGLTIKAYDTENTQISKELRGGDCIVLYHKELKGYLTGYPFAERSPVILELENRGMTRRDLSSNAMFIVEWEDPLQGGVLQAAAWNQQAVGSQNFRLRLLGCGDEAFYLTLRQRTAADKKRPSIPTLQPAKSFVDVAKQMSSTSAHRSWERSMVQPTMQVDSVELNDWVASLCTAKELKNDKGSLFQFLQAGDDRDAQLKDTSRVIVWAPSAGRIGKEMKSVFMSVGGYCNLGRGEGKDIEGYEVGCSSVPQQKDGFELRRVPADMYLSLNSVLSQLPPITQYIQGLQLMASDPKAPPPEPDRLLSSLEEMIIRCTKSTLQYTDVLDHEGTPDPKQQQLLVDQNVPRMCLMLLQEQQSLGFSPVELFDPRRQATRSRSTWNLLKRRSRAGSDTENTERIPPRNSLRIARLCLKLIRFIVRGSVGLALRTAEELGESGLQFLRRLPAIENDTLMAVGCLNEIYRDNRRLLSLTKEEHTAEICESIMSTRWQSPYIRFLPSMLVCEHTGVDRLQDVAAQVLLLSENRPPFMPLRLEKGRVEIQVPFPLSFGSPAEAEEIGEDGESPMWMAFGSFCDVSDEVKNPTLGPVQSTALSTSFVVAKQDEMFEYFRHQVELMSALCSGMSEVGSSRVEHITTNYLPIDCCYRIMMDNTIPDVMRAAFIRFLAVSHVDVPKYPNKHIATKQIVKVWERFDDPITFRCPEELVSLKKFILEYLREHRCISYTALGKISMTGELLNLLTLFLKAGFIAPEEFTEVSSLMVDLLDGTMDIFPKHLSTRSRKVRSRRVFTEEVRYMLDSKRAAFTVLNMILDYIHRRTIDKLLVSFKAHVDGEKETRLPHLSQLVTCDPNSDLDEKSEANLPEEQNFLLQGFGMLRDGMFGGLNAVGSMGKALGKMTIGLVVKGAFDDNPKLPYPEFNRLIEVLLDCALHEYRPFMLDATRLLFRFMNRAQDFLEILDNVQLLQSDESVVFYHKVKKHVDAILDVFKGRRVHVESAQLEITQNCNALAELCCGDNKKLNFEHQCILRNLKVHRSMVDEIVTEFIHELPIPEELDWVDLQDSAAAQSISGTPVPTDPRIRMMHSVFTFLISLALNNPDNQHELFPFCDLFSEYLAYNIGVLKLLKLLYSTPQKCAAVTEKVLRQLLLVNPGSPSHLAFVRWLLKPEKRIISRNQQILFVLIGDVHGDGGTGMLNFVDDPGSWTSRKQLRVVEQRLHQNDHCNPEGQVARHLSLLAVLHLCVKGKDARLKRDLRAELWTDRHQDGVEHVLNTVSRSELPMWYRSQYVRVLHEVFIDDPAVSHTVWTTVMRDKKNGLVRFLDLVNKELERWPSGGPTEPSVQAEGGVGKVRFEVSSEADSKAGNHLLHGFDFGCRALTAEYLFGSVMQCVKHLLATMPQDDDTDEFHAEKLNLLHSILKSYAAIAQQQKELLGEHTLPGHVGGHEPRDEIRPISYVDLVVVAMEEGKTGLAKVKTGGNLLPPLMRKKLAELLNVSASESLPEQIRLGYVEKLVDGLCNKEEKGGNAKIESAADEGVQQSWKVFRERLRTVPALQRSRLFKSLCFILTRKGELGKDFISNTIIGKESSDGTVFYTEDGPRAATSSTLQLDSLMLLSRLCECPSPSECIDGKGGDDANIVAPFAGFVTEAFKEEEEETSMDADRVVLREDMTMEERQNALDEFGAAAKLVTLVGAPGPGASLGVVTETALLAGTALLEGGNARVQASIMRCFKARPDEEFFVNIRQQLRQFTEALKELRRALKKESTLDRFDRNEVKGEGQCVTVNVRDDDDEDEVEGPVDLKAQPLPEPLVEEMKSRFPIHNMITLLRFVQLMCEGHNLSTQNYLRVQPDNQVSIDVIESVVAFLQSHKYLNRIIADVVIQTLATLKECVQGPCLENQDELVSNNIGETVCKIINDGEGPRVHKVDLLSTTSEAADKMWEIREQSVWLLVALTEGSIPYTMAKNLVSSVRLEVLADNMALSYRAAGMDDTQNLLMRTIGMGMSVVKDLLRPEGTGPELTDKLNLGCGVFIFFKVMLDLQILKQRDSGNREPFAWLDKEDKTIRQVLRKPEYAMYQFFNQTVACIEIARGESVERVYFRVLLKSKLNLPERSMEDVKNEVQRESGDGVRVADFFDKCLGLIHEIDYYEEMRNTRGLALVHKFSVPLEWISLAMSFAINIFLLDRVYYINDATRARVKQGREEEALNAMGMAIIILQCLQMTHFAMGPTRIYLNFQWMQWEQEREDERMRECKANLNVHPINREGIRKDELTIIERFVYSIWMLTRYWPLFQRALYLGCSFLGYYVSPIWYCFQPLQVIGFSAKLLNVVLAVTTNGRSLLLTFGLMLIVVYMFAIWAFFRFSMYFDGEEEFGVGYNCDTLFKCWILLLTYGLRMGGGMGDILTRPHWSDEYVVERIVFDMLYFLVLIILFLNIVFGIIIDTFAELREKRAFIEDDQQRKCFICGMERSVFDREAGAQGGFEHHYKYEHNMWTYLYFLHYIKEKDKDDLSGQEKYVNDMVEDKDPNFFPVGKAMVLVDAPPDDDLLEKVMEKLPDKQYMERAVTGLKEQLVLLESRINRADGIVSPTNEAPEGSPSPSFMLGAFNTGTGSMRKSPSPPTQPPIQVTHATSSDDGADEEEDVTVEEVHPKESS